MTTISPMLTRLASESSPERFERVAAQLLTFELYSSVRAQGRFTETHAHAADEIRRRLDGAELTPMETALCTVLAALPEWGDRRVGHVAMVGAYSAWLEYAEGAIGDALFDVAAFVLSDIGAQAELDGYGGISAQARVREAFALASQAKWDEADWLYVRAWELGRAARHWSIAYRAQLGRVNILRQRGNLPGAEEMLQEVITSAPRRAPDILPRALLLRGAIAHARGLFEDAVVWAGRALQVVDDDVIRMRILMDLASFMTDVADVRVANVARQTLEYVAVNASDRRIRLHANVTLLSHAVNSRREEAFRVLRASIPVPALAPLNLAYYWLYVAEGCRKFGMLDEMLPALDEAERVARAHRLSQVQFTVEAERERALAAMNDRSSVSPEPTISNPTPVVASRRVLRMVNRVSRTLAMAT